MNRTTRRRLTGTTAAGLAMALAALGACAPGGGPDSEAGVEPAREEARSAARSAAGSAAERALRETLERAKAAADAVEDELRPVPLLTPAQENRLRTHLNAVHVSRARQLGVRPANEAEIRSLVASGRLVALEPSTEHWTVRDRAQRRAFVTPDVVVLLEEIAERFQAVLAERGIPAYRMEITSVLRTAEDQAALRRRNPNAAAGVSSHEFGTTLDIAYESFVAPLDLPDGIVADGPAGMRAELEQVAVLALETVGNRKSREMQAFMGQVLTEMQAEGKVLVILERQQPVFHITVGRRLALSGGSGSN